MTAANKMPSAAMQTNRMTPMTKNDGRRSCKKKKIYRWLCYQRKDKSSMIKQEVCPICKTALKDTKEKQVQCITCNALISTDVEWQSKYGYEWVEEDAKT